MNSILKVGAAGALALTCASVHATITASRSSSTPGDLLLFAEIVNDGIGVAYYVGDTHVAVGGLTPTSALQTGNLITAGGDENLAALLAMAGTGGNTLEWAVQGGGYDSSFNGSVLTTVSNSNDLLQLKSRVNASVGFMINGGINGLINTTLNPLVGSGSSYEGTTTTRWDVTGGTPPGMNGEYWFNNGTQTAQTGFSNAMLYSVVAPDAGGFTVASVGGVTLSAQGLSFSSTGGPQPDSYNESTRRLTIPTLAIGSATYSNVVVTVAGIVSGPSGSTPNGAVDSYDPETAQLTVQTVTVGPNTYHNVVVMLTGLDSIGSVTGADNYNGESLTISAVQVGATIYTDVVITVAGIVGVDRGMPEAALDTYSFANNELSIAAVEFNGAVYTNVIVRVGSIEHVGGSGPAPDEEPGKLEAAPRLMEGGGDIFGKFNRP
jgi:hypothetical protein